MNPLARTSVARPSRGPRRIATAAVAIVAAVCAIGVVDPARAQYQWTDESGRKVYSDVPPPPAARVNNLVRRPDVGARTAAAAPGPDGALPAGVGIAKSANAGSTAAPGAPVSIADKEMAFQKRRNERAEADQKAAQKAEAEAKNSQACEDSRSSLRSLESGLRVTRINAVGEREVLSDDERQQRIRSIRRDIGSRC